MVGTFSRLLARAAMWGLRRFYHVSRVGPPIPDGPVLVIANHPNSLIDALVVMELAGRRVRPLAKSGLFAHPLMAPVLKGLSALPVYRRQDDAKGEGVDNEHTFSAAIAALRSGEAVLIFPEGLTHSRPHLAPMKTGAARIALRAEEASDWSLGLRVAPVGLTYHRKHAFRGRVAAMVGRPLKVSTWRERRQSDEWGSVESLTEAMGRALGQVTLNVSTHEDRELIEAAETIYATEKRLAKPRQRDGLGRRLPRLQRFADAVAWLRDTDRGSYERLAASVRTYRRRLALLGANEGDLPRRFRALPVLRYTLFHGLALLVALPIALAGSLVWYLPYKSPKLSIGYYRPDFEAVATLKLATALLAFPVTYTLWLTIAWLIGGVWALFFVAIALPIAGAVALRWRDRWGMVREDARLFWRSVKRRDLREQLLGRRKTLVSEFDRLALEWQRERRHRRRSELAGWGAA